MRIILALAIAFTLSAQIREGTVMTGSPNDVGVLTVDQKGKMTCESVPNRNEACEPKATNKPPQFSHEQKDKLQQAALTMFWTRDQAAAAIAAANEQKAKAEAAYAQVQAEMLKAIGCPSGQVDISMSVTGCASK